MAITWSLFPLLYRGKNSAELAHLLRATGIDTINALVRESFGIREEFLREDLSTFVFEMAGEGITVNRASTSFSAAQLIGSESPLPILRDCGIQEFRMGWFPRFEKSVRTELSRARETMEQVAEACQRHQIKAIYQVHHRTLITNPTAAFFLVNGLDPRWVGIELDPGNQSFEGFEPWDHACDLLREYVAWIGVKDTRVWQETPRSEEAGKGWLRAFCPINDGVTNFQELVLALAHIRFNGTFVMMPFYDEYDEISRTPKLQSEVEYLRAIVDSVSITNS